MWIFLTNEADLRETESRKIPKSTKLRTIKGVILYLKSNLTFYEDHVQNGKIFQMIHYHQLSTAQIKQAYISAMIFKYIINTEKCTTFNIVNNRYIIIYIYVFIYIYTLILVCTSIA